MTTEEVKKLATVKKTCQKCQKRIRVQPMRLTCPVCGSPFYKKPEKEAEKKIEKKDEVRVEKKIVEKVIPPEETKTSPVITPQIKDKKSKREKLSSLDEHFFIHSGRGAEAEATVDEDGIRVLKGSVTAPDWVNSTPKSVRQKGENLRNAGLIVDNKFTTFHIFSSPSTAAGIVMGRSANGLKEWKTKEGKTLKEIIGEQK